MINWAALMETPLGRDLYAIAMTGERLLALDTSLLGRESRAGDAVAAPSTVQVIRMHGVIMPRGDSGAEGYVRKINAAAANPDIGAIVLDINSPGGAVYGTSETADAVAAAKQQKPVYAIADPMAASALYWIASQASQFWVTPSGEVGSIGVKAMHLDISKALADAGVGITEITAGQYKGERSMFAPLSDEAKAQLQADADREHGNFINAVARGRGVSRDTVADTFGQGRMIDANRAVKLGMADRVGTMSDLMSSLRTKTGAVRRRASIF